MIEIRTVEFREGYSGTHVFVNDDPLPSAQVIAFSGSNDRHYIVTVQSPDDIARIATHRISEIPPEISDINLDLDHSLSANDVLLSVNLTRSERRPRLGYTIKFRVALWKNPWSMGEFRNLIKRRIDEGLAPGLLWSRNRSLGEGPSFALEIPTADTELPIEAILNNWTPTVRSLITNAMQTLAKDGPLVATFDFPQEVRVPCEQYLLYFAEFLKELGIDADTNLRHEAGRVLFSIAPRNGEEALDKIREALAIYLQLPDTPMSDSPSNIAFSPPAQQLLANIQHLKGQLYLANAALQLKDATIGQLSTTIEGQRHIIESNVVGTSLKALSSNDKSTEKEDVIEGMLAITKYKSTFFEVDLPEMLRRLKRRLTTKAELTERTPSDEPDEGF